MNIEEKLLETIQDLYQRLEDATRAKAAKAEVRTEAQMTLGTLREEVMSQEPSVSQKDLDTLRIQHYKHLV